ncbi:CAAD domain-containing protein [Nostocaceae cyanobacterium CENA369]|uniref:CAAD domain-containing protein n=1 Tax=Dendronalium phyllosphericum CENA369 TaxID=1725256 RepID=A0A8J7LJ71_9NOST|nr:CAAD domain-containing protein [Dendronalium phyllosphericum]MBH8577309.1 CAAD domain-containing protein [Dendronalium phyllosphericum CENA369]
MEAQQQQFDSPNTSPPEALLALESADNQNLPKLPPAKEPETQWQRISRIISDFLEQLPEYLGNFFETNKQSLITVALIFTAIVTVRVVLALLDVINDIPLFSPIFELIGISYTTWFVFRYLLKSSTRQELAAEIQLLKQQITGK